MDKLIVALSADIKDLKSKLTEAQALLKGFGNTTDDSIKPNSLRAFEKELEKLNKEFRNTEIGTTKFKELATQIDATKSKMANATSQMAKQSVSSFDSIGTSLKNLIAVYASFQAAQAVVSKAFNTSLKIDAFNAAMTQVLGSSEKANQQFEQLSNTANKLGLDLLTLTDTYKSFAGATITAGVSQAQTNAIFNAFAGVASKLRLSNEDLEGSLRAVAQMFSKGTVSAEELRGQLGERMPGAFALAAKSMGLTTKELGKMMESGQIMASDLIPRLASELEKMGGTDTKIDSLQASVNRLNNTFANAVASGNLGKFFKLFVDGANDIVKIFESQSFKLGVERFIFLATGNAAGVNKLNAIESALKSVNEQLVKSQQLANGTLRFDFTATELLGNLKEQKKIQADLNAELKKGRQEKTLTVAEQAKLTMQLARQNQLVEELKKIEASKNANKKTTRVGGEAMTPMTGASDLQKEAKALFDLYKQSPDTLKTMGSAYANNPFFRDLINGDLNNSTLQLTNSSTQLADSLKNIKMPSMDLTDMENVKLKIYETIKALELQQERTNLLLDATNMLASGFGNAFASAIIDGKNFGDAMGELFKSIGRMILAEIARMIALRIIISALAGIATGGASAAAGAVGAAAGAAGAITGGRVANVGGSVPLSGSSSLVLGELVLRGNNLVASLNSTSQRNSRIR